MIEFGGWEMPLQYSGIVDEHLAVRRAVSLFDVSHMGKIFVEGPTAHTFLDRLSANDVPTLAGKARYTHLLREDGTILDDVIVTCLAADRFLLVCNAGPRHPAGAGPLRCRWTRVVPCHPNRLHGRGGVRALSYRGGGIVGLGIAPEVRGGPRDPADRPRRAGHPSPGERLPVVRTRFRRTPDAPRGELRLGREMGPAVHWSRGA